MANPITNRLPVVETNNLDDLGSFYIRKVRTKQAKPYDLPARYTLTRVNTTFAKKIPGTATFDGLANANASKGKYNGVGNNFFSYYTLERDLAVNSVRSKLSKYMLAANAGLGITIAQRQQTIDMITKRGSQLLRFFTSLRKGDLKKARQAAESFGWLRPGGRRKKKRRAPPQKDLQALNKDAANLLLEAQFGWVPTIQTVYDGCKLLSEPITCVPVDAVSFPVSCDFDYYRKINANSYEKSTVSGRVRATAHAEAWIDNPDLYLANRLGLINPAQVLWDWVPWSFIVDWFVSVNAFLGSLTDFFGVSVRNASYTVKYKLTQDFIRSQGSNTYGYQIKTVGTHFERELGLPPFKLIIKRFELNLFHVRTVWALLVQKL